MRPTAPSWVLWKRSLQGLWRQYLHLLFPVPRIVISVKRPSIWLKTSKDGDSLDDLRLPFAACFPNMSDPITMSNWKISPPHLELLPLVLDLFLSLVCLLCHSDHALYPKLVLHILSWINHDYLAVFVQLNLMLSSFWLFCSKCNICCYILH